MRNIIGKAIDRFGFARTLVIGCVLALAVGIALVLFVHPDIYPALGTYGTSIGTDAHYCSADLVHWRPALSCESAS